MTKHDEQREKMIKDLREAADQLEAVKDKSPEEVDHVLTDIQICCGTCTGVSAIPPCVDTCIKVSAGF